MQDLSMGCVTEVVNSEEKLYTETANFGDSGKSHITDWIAVWTVFYHASQEPFCIKKAVFKPDSNKSMQPKNP